jgi:hypothetical protein
MGLFTLYKIGSAIGGSKKVEAVTAPAAKVAAGSIPSVDSPEFDAWVNTPGNLEKYLSS